MTTKKQITAKFTGRCTSCNGTVASGTRCNWESGVGVTHIVCPEQNNAIVAPRVAAADNKPVTVTMGVFKKDNRIYVVKPNKEKTRVYAKEIVESPARMTESGLKVDFEARYAPGIVFKLTEADRWPLVEAKDFLTKFSRCIVCGRHLKAAKSVERSIGPVCAGYFKGSSHVNACADHDSTAPQGAVAAAVDSIAKSPKTIGEIADAMIEQPIVRNGFDRYAQNDESDHSMRKACELIREDSKHDTAAEDYAHLIERERQDWIDSKSTLSFDDWRREEITRHHMEEAEIGLL